jgi:putative ABC transport system permease protein
MTALKVFEKNFLKNKTTNLLSIWGLSLGIAVSVLLGWWALNEMRADLFHSDHLKIYRICREGYINNESIRVGSINSPLAKQLRDQFPQIEDQVRIALMGKERFGFDEKINYEDAVMLAEPGFFSFFSFPLKQGDIKTCLDEPDEMVITEQLAAKYFGEDDPVGQIVEFMGRDWRISAVMYDVPANSHLQFEALCAMAGLPDYDNAPWGWDLFNVYVKLAPETDILALSKQITEVAREAFPPYKDIDIHHFMQPLADIHFDTRDFRFDNAKKSDKRFVLIFSLMALAILTIACINFTNLFISTAFLRARSIGLKKANGAGKGSLIREFYMETTLFVLISMVAGIILAKLALPLFNKLADTRLILDFNEPALLAYLVGIALITILMAGSFPAFFLTRFRPAASLKGELKEKNISFFQKALVVLQFAASIILLLSVFTIRRQVNYVQTTDLGFNKSNIICLSATGPFSESYDMIKQELERYPEIIEVTAKNSLPSEWRHGSGISASEEDDPFIVEICDIKENYLDMMDISIVAGIPFEDYNDSLNYVWINEQTARLLGFENPVDQVVSHEGTEYTIKGVISDIKSKSLHNQIDPQVYIKLPELRADHVVMIKISDDQKAAIARVQEKWEELNPNYPFDYRFLDQAYDEMYKNEERAGSIVTWGMLIAMFITIIGLFAMAAYATERRTKEIGIRRVNGAELTDILVLLNKNFLQWVIVACVVALPLGWYIMKGWLDSFAYRTNVSWWILVASAIAALFISVLTVSWQSYIAVRKNPVESLRYE